LMDEIGALQGNEGTVQEDLVQLQKERAELKERVEKALTLIASLEAPETA
jgi:hypothetical protein